jgi:radical SAM protein with 4Fe4S-binding SPASM domain
MNNKLTNVVELRQHLDRYGRDDLLETIYHALPKAKRAAFLDYRKKWVEADRNRIELPFPLCISLELVSDCNLHCAHCIRNRESWREKAPSHFQKQRMGMETYRRIVDECVREGLPSLWLGCSGEALLEPDLCQMLSYAHDRGILDLILTTNGTLLTEEIVDRLLAIPLTRLHLSVDAFTEETYRKVRGGNLAKVKSMIEYLLRRKEELGVSLPVVRLTYIDLPANRQEQAAFIDYWTPRVDVVDIQKYIDFDIQQPLPDSDQREFHCSCPWRIAVINANGDLIPCNSFYAHFGLIMDNVHESSIKEIWDSARYRSLKDSLQAKQYTEACRICFSAQAQSESG